jgi:hypothetical protein
MNTQFQNRMINTSDIRYNGKSGLLPQFEDRNYEATIDIIKGNVYIPEGDIANVVIWRDKDGKQTPMLVQGDYIICAEDSWRCRNCFRRIG